MARNTPSHKGWQPSSDAATYRDLLLFEERLKNNVSMLRRRKRRYQIFLLNLIVVIIVLTADVLLSTGFFAWPLKSLLHQLSIESRPDVGFHPYLAPGALLVAITTLVLFYASGMYAEKIGYANRYVPHANRALRSFNMHLNVRAPPLSAFRSIARFFTRSPRAAGLSTNPTSPNQIAGRNSRRTTPISPIPPTTNPRGELIFTSRVDKQFREAYERYRAAFERKRDQRVLADATAAAWSWIPGTRRSSSQRAPGPTEKTLRTPSGSRSTTPVGSRKTSPSRQSSLPRATETEAEE